MSTTSRTRRLALVAAAAATATVAWACNDTTSPAGQPDLDRGGNAGGALHRVYGPAVQVGEGSARTYVAVRGNGTTPEEVGVALDERAMDGLPAPMAGHDPHHDMHMYALRMPARNGTPYKYVELDWNPQGHGFPYAEGHFDFHFYTITQDEVAAIDPEALGPAQYAAKSQSFPGAEYMPQWYLALAAPGDPVMAVPKMGVHWVDVRAPELQGILGHEENYRPFTTTFINGTWDGKTIFSEPMITRSFIMSRRAATTEAGRDSAIALPMAQRAQVPGYYPGGYRITWDAQAREYRIALTQLTWKQ